MTFGQPKITPELDPGFRPAAVWVRDFEELVGKTDDRVPFRLALTQPNGTCTHQSGFLLPSSHPQADANFKHVERILKFLLWACGGSEWI